VSNRLIARRYAKALAGIAENLDDLIQIQRELAVVASAVKVNTDLRRLVSHSLLTPMQKMTALDAILVVSGASVTIRNFFSVVARAARLNLISELSSVFDEIVDERTGTVVARIQTAHPVSESQFVNLEEVLSSLTGKKIKINWHQDRSIIGGVKIQIGSTVYDASIKGQLSLVKAKLVLV
jgi:F-type H+-transporting ATPase subunit delta